MIINKIISLIFEIDLFLHSTHLPFNSFVFVFRLSAILITFHNSTFLTTAVMVTGVLVPRQRGFVVTQLTHLFTKNVSDIPPIDL